MEANLFMLAANIARPGTLSASEGFAFADGALILQTKPFYAERLSNCVNAATKLGWPRFTPVSIRDVWEWMRTSCVIKDGVGTDSMGRALSALSHLTSESLNDSSSIELVWILLGLEALYSKGNVGLKEQLLAKTEPILGRRIENKKAFGAVYDFRSRLIHGDIDIPMRFTSHDAVPAFEEFQSELSRNESIALAALIATLQFMTARNLRSLVFKYELQVGSPSAQ